MTSITPSPEMGLLPCPFCGGAVKLETYSADYKRIEFCVMCHECDFCTAEGLTAEETVTRWNTRAKPALSCPDGFRLVPVEPTAEMLDRAVAFALNVTLSGEYNWSAYMRDVWRTMLAASPAPAVDNAGWRPIASFPKDGELYLVCDDRSLDGDHQVVFWDEDLETPFKLHTPDGPAFHEAAFTHWQPLPSAPSQDAPPPRSLSNKD